MPFSNSVPVTINSTTQHLTPSWDGDYKDAIASGSTSIRKDETGSLKLRISHDESKKGRQRHLAQLIQTVVVDTTLRTRKVHVVIEHDDYPGEAAAAEALAVGLGELISSETVMLAANLVADQL